MTAADLLKSAPIDPKESRLLLAYSLGVDSENLAAHPEMPVNALAAFRFRRALRKFRRGWSIAAITGHKGFYGLDFLVNGRVLIPRPETELMVEELERRADGGCLIDIGTGPGTIIVTAAKVCGPGFSAYYAADISRAALRLARRNAARQGLAEKIIFYHGSLLSPFKNLGLPDGPITIAANLPYLTPEQVAASPSIRREPRRALISGRDGLDHYRQLFKEAAAYFPQRQLAILCEIDPSQKEALETLAAAVFPGAEISTLKDLAGRDRLTIIKTRR